MTAATLYPYLQTCPLPYSQLVTVALKDGGRRVAMSKCMRVGWVSLQLNDSSCFIRSDIVPTRTAPRTKVTDFFTHLDARRSARATGPQENVAIYNVFFWDTFSTRMIKYRKRGAWFMVMLLRGRLSQKFPPVVRSAEDSSSWNAEIILKRNLPNVTGKTRTCFLNRGSVDKLHERKYCKDFINYKLCLYPICLWHNRPGKSIGHSKVPYWSWLGFC